MAKRSQQFQTIRTEGAILPPDILRRIASLKVEGATPDAYHLSPGSKLNEAISQSWTSLLNHWRAFQEALANLPESDETATAVTNERWLLPLFKELDFGRLVTGKSPEIDERVYPIERFYNHTPIHLIGCRLPLDCRTKGARGAATASPHSMVQEFLNRSDEHLWAFLSNGLQLRILRDNVSLSRQAFVEFDLEAMMDGEVYADFALLWLLCHQSRIESDKAVDCWLEKWSHLARDQGTRVLNDLRVGVAKSIEALGRGFIGHPRNDRLREKLRTGSLSTDEFYRQLLRTVYRLLFLFVAEDRELLHPPDSAAEACNLYDTHYSTRRLRELAHKIRGSKHADLWHSLSLVFDALSRNEGCPELGLCGLGSFLWRSSSTSDLLGPGQQASKPEEDGGSDPVLITNDDLLQSIRALAYVEQDNVLRIVDYRNLGSEELGSVYESLLELNPVMNVAAQSFDLSVAAGNERKTSGSYYTHELIVQALLDRSLEPLVLERTRGKKSEDAGRAILDLKICDPATGSGHFLIAVAHRLARHLARVRTGETEPSPEDYQHALRDVIGHCIYGVDINPMAVELCKVSLWMEAMEPGKPLTFLDHHIQCGNSVVGATPALLKAGIPNEAFKGIEGDDAAVCTEFRGQNRDERRGQMRLDFESETFPWERLGTLATGLAQLETEDDDSFEAVENKEQRYERIVSSTDYLFGRFLADVYCAAFFWLKTMDLPYPITEEVFRSIEKNPHSVLPWMREEIQRLARRYQFFHWHLSFPGVFRVPAAGETPENAQHGWSGGFDPMLGNPPWDTLSPDAKEFFAAYDEQVRFQDRAGQAAIIGSLLENEDIAQRWAAYRRRLYAEVLFFKNSGRFRLYAPGNLGKGDFNIFRMFAELSLDFTAPAGFASQIIPDGLYGGANCMAIRRELYEHFELSDIWGFENTREVWFKGIDSRTKFCMYAARAGGSTDEFSAAFGIRSEERLADVRAGDRLRLPVSLVREFSPDALAVTEVANQQEVDIARKMYSAWPKFGDENASGPKRVYMRELDMGNDRDVFCEDPNGIPLYEGRMVWQFDHRAKGYRSGRGRRAVWEDLPFDSLTKSIQPQWRVLPEDVPEKCSERMQRFRIGFCDVSSPTNERSLVAAIVPPATLSGHKVPTILFEPYEAHTSLLWLAVANSFAMDFIIRQKVGLTMSYTLLDSMPFPRLPKEHAIARPIVERALRLTCTGTEMVPFWNEMAEEGWCEPFESPDDVPGTTDETERLQLRAELDVLVARELYGLTRDEMEYILGTFPTAERYEVAKYGEFRLKRLILELYETLEVKAESATAADRHKREE